MKLPVVYGTIDRRILANYQVDPIVLAKVLPAPFRPKIVHGAGIAGICLIRLKHIKPFIGLGRFGIASENAAHRIAVEWDEDGVVREGVYIPRRDTSSKLNALAGGRLFPGLHHHARYQVIERGDFYSVRLDSKDGETHVLVEGRQSAEWPLDSVFKSVDEASAFFEAGSLGYSATDCPGSYDGLELRSFDWHVEPLAISKMESSFFENNHVFPEGSVRPDCALLMRNIRHEWHGRKALHS